MGGNSDCESTGEKSGDIELEDDSSQSKGIKQFESH